MAWILPTVAAVGAIGNLALGASNAGANNRQQQQQFALERQQMQEARNNEMYQRAVQQLVNQRAVAGSQDSFGTTVQYDPATNTWVQSLGPLPKQGDIAAINANITRNTTDLANQELVNQVAMRRAAEAGLGADTARRNLENFKPISSDTLAGLLTQQGITAARQAYDPLRADTLRAVARTGTAAGPVLRQLGLGEAQNLRNTLIDAQLKGITGAADINNANYGRLQSAAGTTAALATPNAPALGQSGLGSSSADQLLAQLTANRAQWAPSSTAQGAYGANISTDLAGRATNAAAGAVPNSNFGLQQIQSGLKDLSSFASNSGPSGLQSLLTSIFGSGSNNTPSSVWEGYSPSVYNGGYSQPGSYGNWQ